MVYNTIPTNIAIPPSVGVGLECDVRPLAEAQRFFDLEIFTIDGVVNQVMPNTSKDPGMIIIQWGQDIENMLKISFDI